MTDTKQPELDNPQIVLGMLQALDGERRLSQRSLAAELGIALGLVNAYLKRCVSKGLVKVAEAPARRYAYYLTPLGFAEKSRLTLEYLSSSFEFFRRAKTDCSDVFRQASAHGYRKILFVGRSDLADIAALCAQEHDVEIVGLVEATSTEKYFFKASVFNGFADAPSCDAVVITDLRATHALWQDAVARFGRERVLLPALLRHVTTAREVQP